MQLYRCWTLNNTSDVHFINYIKGFMKTRDAKPDEILLSRKEMYNIEIFSTTSVTIDTLNRIG